ncbi:hypothetical protein K844_06837, partial [Mycobacterium tuberculosis TKK-01-0014]
ERGRKPGEQRRRQPGGHGSVVRPKTPRGDGNQVSNGGGNLAATGRSSDPKPREGTETAWTRASCRWSGRSSDPKPREGTETSEIQAPRHDHNASSDPKPREGTETSEIQAPRHDHNASSDPKPREGTETGQRSTPALVDFRVVRPKTPRGDGNLERVTADGTIETSRQTQNPERGRKLGEPISDHRTLSVVRPKTPRGDGNFITPDQIGIGVFKSSDPKPREGTETF